MKSCTDCMNWVPQTKWAGCGKINTTFPAHCPYVIDPEHWVAEDCKQYAERVLPRRNDNVE